ncbi:hypothetical protein GE21DRAFT_7346 [Neurospora crassa]|uniref:Uncharacterized protein n=2 Tax=Neurospora crassa TaxID=5141 RepID=Q1K7A5_NEUCR|nr:hypothetical protein NCU03775 [Neurospora crassa OR74A]EAA31885.1 hypothetical protein NCU03775 [Neurospora crassa OR74A]KHE88157.1 hypothetical protein GE21DRAFT_7346 [Neurospora crassa]CAC28823.2 hypothetical protein [Neurospora crassa]|eukprot:XP_961121.1 hypothetical protein NCU03775 [Neurospora crassa OR74A]
MDSWGAPVSAAAAAMSAAPAVASHGPLTSATFWSCDAEPIETQTAAPVFTTEYCVTLPTPCHHGPGPCHATYTVTEECTGDRDSWAQPTGVVPPGFVVTTVTDCNACHGGPTQTFTMPTQTSMPTNVGPAPGPGPQPTMSTSVVVMVPSQTGGQMPVQTAGAPPARTMSLKTSMGLLVGAALALLNFA